MSYLIRILFNPALYCVQGDVSCRLIGKAWDRRKIKQCQCQLYQTCRYKMNTKSDRRTDGQTDISSGNSVSPKSMESSTSRLSLVDETSCLINCCRCLLPDAQWWKNAYTHVSEVQITEATTYTMYICNHTLTHCRLNGIDFLFCFCLNGKNYTCMWDHLHRHI